MIYLVRGNRSGATVTITFGTSSYTVPADSTGAFKKVISPQAAGTVINVTAADQAGNISQATMVTVRDKTAPMEPQVNDVTDQSKEISGTTEAGATGNITVGTNSIR